MKHDSMRWRPRTMHGFRPDIDDDVDYDPLAINVPYSNPYLIVLPLDEYEPLKNERYIPVALKRSDILHRPGVYESCIKSAVRLMQGGDFGKALAAAHVIAIDQGIFIDGPSEAYQIVDWLHELGGAVLHLYNRFDGRPFLELLVNRLIAKDAVCLNVYPT